MLVSLCLKDTNSVNSNVFLFEVESFKSAFDAFQDKSATFFSVLALII